MAADPTLYDILGVSRDATPAQIKAAWREATDRFDPETGSRQFSLFNDAAAVLLDPERRAAYDAELAEREPVAAVEPEPVPVDTESAEESAEEPAAPPAAASSGRRAIPTWALAVLAVVTVLVVGVAAYLWNESRQADAVDEARLQAPAAAERAAVAVLSYDYERLEADAANAVKHLTPAFREDYQATIDNLVEAPASEVEGKVEAEVLASGVMRASADRVDVLLYVNQTTTSLNNEGEPQLSLNRVRLEMVDQDGTWLVNEITSY